mmetsp:Transcript_17364/g.59376  ORF Transcript_17364/g.59376 Transcript_17364/m.59376 type:complete len:327 (+) Transcript_17364:3-983(+)
MVPMASRSLVDVRVDDLVGGDEPPGWWAEAAGALGEPPTPAGWGRVQRLRILGSLQRYYLPLKHVFQYYCVFATVGVNDPFHMGVRQFQLFAKDCRLKLSHKEVDLVFERTNQEMEPGDKDGDSELTLTLDEFLESLVRLAHARFHAGAAGGAEGPEAEGRCGDLAEAATRALADHVLPHAQRLAPEEDFEAEWTRCREEVQARYAKEVGRIFRSFPKQAQAPPGKNDHLLYGEWMAFLTKHRMICQRLSAARALAIFVLVNNTGLPLSLATDRAAAEREEQKLDEAEFLKALCYVAREHALGVRRLRGADLPVCLDALLEGYVLG